jgi:hypothetical protein
MGMRLISFDHWTISDIAQKIARVKTKSDNLYYGDGFKLFQELETNLKMLVLDRKDKPISVDFWTSGFSRNEGNFVWCPTGQLVPDFKQFPNSLQSKLSPLDAENCLLSKNGEKTIEVVAENCSLKQNFICEVFHVLTLYAYKIVEFKFIDF